jgi:hypothetical protein
MRQINAILVLAVMCGSFSSFAGDKKQPRSLADDAIILEQSMWMSGEVTVTSLPPLAGVLDDGKKKARGKLLIQFAPDKGKASGRLSTEFHVGKAIAPGPNDRLKFELMEKDGKRFIKMLELVKGEKEPKLRATVEYSLKAGELTLKGGVVPEVWAFADVDLTKGVLFKPSFIDLPK